jgi:hypothetical protein
MDPLKAKSVSSPELLYLAIAILRDVQTLHSEVISPESLHRDAQKVSRRVVMEGPAFLTKALPALGKAVDSALSGASTICPRDLGFKTKEDTQIPLLLGELFVRVFDSKGRVLPDPCVRSIKSLRMFLYFAYKYELPYDHETEATVLAKFEETEREVACWSKAWDEMSQLIENTNDSRSWLQLDKNLAGPISRATLIKKARKVLFQLFKRFDPDDIEPSNGPGALSTGEKLWEKWTFTKVSARLTEQYPLDAYFFASLSHLCDRPQAMSAIELGEDSAKIVLVPKDSRGPRIISCESHSNMWIQQGLMRAIVRHVEQNALTKHNVHFTDQGPNQKGALIGSRYGQYATLDLNEASDRVPVGLVKLLFPGHVVNALLSCRSLTTRLPDGKVIELSKFAPMGSAVCFPVLALIVWVLLYVGTDDADTRDGILVYGDDVVVKSGYAAHAMTILEWFGLKINHSKSYTTGFFRESCGVDAYRGVDVTPVRLRTVWSHRRSPEVLASWTSYANSYNEDAYFYTYELIAGWLFQIYGAIPDKETSEEACPYLLEVPEKMRPRMRFNKHYQRWQCLAWSLVPRDVQTSIDGWAMLHRYFTNAHSVPLEGLNSESRLRDFCLGLSALPTESGGRRSHRMDDWLKSEHSPFSVCSYTKSRDVKLRKGWIPSLPNKEEDGSLGLDLNKVVDLTVDLAPMSRADLVSLPVSAELWAKFDNSLSLDESPASGSIAS